jgi:hypothetical protein
VKKILLISGKQGSGKTSNTNAIMEIVLGLGYLPVIFKFARPLYEMHDAILPILHKYGIRPEAMTKDGELLQVLGTEYGRRRIRESIWIDVCRRQIDAYLNETGPGTEGRLAVIDDARFENEFDAFPDAFRVRLEAPEEVRKPRCSYWREEVNHSSEIGLDQYMHMGKFDLVVPTDTASVESTSHLIRVEWFRGDAEEWL